jgi:hypothetical protein
MTCCYQEVAIAASTCHVAAGWEKGKVKWSVPRFERPRVLPLLLVYRRARRSTFCVMRWTRASGP